MSDPVEALRYALEKYPERLRLLPVDQLVMDSARGNEKRPAFLKLAVPDEIVKALRGADRSKDVVLLVTIPKEVLERSESPIILPGEI